MKPGSFAAALLAVFPLSGSAQQLPADCSKAAAPKQPLEVSVFGAKFTPKSVKLRPGNDIKSGDAEFDGYRLTISSDVDDFSPPQEATVSVLVKKGQRVDGKTFRKLAVKEIDKQPKASEGLPEVQGWGMKVRHTGVSTSHAEYLASMRLEFGKREGKTISGTIYLCVPKGQTSMFEKTPTKEDSYAVGTFQAQIIEK
jgi:hypothetical protein